MNQWTALSIEYANQKSYLDDLFQVYPTLPEGIREINDEIWDNAQKAFNKRDNQSLIIELLRLDLFPVKDSYIAYLKRDKKAIARNPKTINRICGRLYEMGLDKIYEQCSVPKETNRQIGPMFRDWLRKKRNRRAGGDTGRRALHPRKFQNVSVRFQSIQGLPHYERPCS